MKIFFRLAGWCGCLFLLCGCAILAMPSYLTAYHGRVLDAETRKPIEGAVVLIASYENHFFSPNSTFLGAREGVSDKNGEFVVPPLSWLKPKDHETIAIIKAGYSSWGWRRTGYKYPKNKFDQGKIEWEGRNPIVLLRKLTKEEMRKYYSPAEPDEAPPEDIKHYLQEDDKARVMIGLNPLGNWKAKRKTHE